MNIASLTANQVHFIDGLLELRSVNPEAARKICHAVNLLHDKDQHTQSLFDRFNAGEINAEVLLSSIDVEAQA